MHCETARELLEVCRAGSEDLRAPEISEAAAHLEGCAACRDWFRSIEPFDRAVGRAMREVPVPPGFKQRVLDQVAAVNVGDRRDARRRRLATVLRSRRVWLAAGSLAACLLAIVWLGNRSTRTTVAEVGNVARAWFDDRSQSWQVVDGRFEADDVLDSVEQQRLQDDGPPPTKLRPRYRVGFMAEEFLGHRVAMYCYYFDFAPRPVQAHVYALSDQSFWFDRPISREPTEGVSFDSTNDLITATWQEGEFVYVMVYRGSPDVLERAVSRPGPLTLAAAWPFRPRDAGQ